MYNGKFNAYFGLYNSSTVYYYLMESTYMYISNFMSSSLSNVSTMNLLKK